MGSTAGSPPTGVIITGAASGIGASCARALAAAGRPVALWDISDSSGLAAEIAAETSTAAVAVEMDVTDTSGLPAAIKRSREALGTVGGLVHAAGVSLPVAVGDLDRAGRLVGEEGTLRYSLAPSVATPLLRAADRAAREAGALGSKVCGAGGGGCLVAFAREGKRLEVARAIAGTGASLLTARIARRGLRVSGP